MTKKALLITIAVAAILIISVTAVISVNVKDSGVAKDTSTLTHDDLIRKKPAKPVDTSSGPDDF